VHAIIVTKVIKVVIIVTNSDSFIDSMRIRIAQPTVNLYFLEDFS